MGANAVFVLLGGALLLAVILPHALRSVALSPPLVLLVVGVGLGLLPLPSEMTIDVVDDRELIERLTEFTVIVALMGVGLALDRPLQLRSWESWRRWGASWRLLAVAMPLTIAATAVLGWWAIGLAPASAILLGAALAPTDPVLASDVQVAGPTTEEPEDDEIDESDEVRFALTSEAGLNDGLAFPFVHLAILVAGSGTLIDFGPSWLAWDVLGRVLLGVVVGAVIGRLLALAAFRSAIAAIRTAETGEPLLALAAVLLSYGAAEVLGGYGFLSVFACAMAIRSAERSADYHDLMHQVVQQLERLLTLIVLLLLGVALSTGILSALTVQAAGVGLALLLVIRPLVAWISLRVGSAPVDRVGDRHLGPAERLATAFFGVRGIGSIYYLAYATGHADFEDAPVLWSTVAFTVTASIVIHGITATPVMRRLERARDARRRH